ncbi:hypothetical protein Pmani_012954 [Petrolisthes manimaculis]|uniref:Uncharacterized protein n=1 Tax=Petrolisthes manimaculis TaxID=1843537 RepID=A0AAE1PZU5_9EUCA|nr:hypothetical protein Pmani_012954 [Petrolisthes manimaculis]
MVVGGSERRGGWIGGGREEVRGEVGGVGEGERWCFRMEARAREYRDTRREEKTVRKEEEKGGLRGERVQRGKKEREKE